MQQPGTARSSKRKIFSDKSFYNRVFKHKHDNDTIVDILKLSDFFDRYISKAHLNEKASNISKNGKLSILAIICFLLKNKRKLVNNRLDTGSSEWASDVISDNLNGGLLDPERPDDFDIILNSIFNEIVMTLSSLYDSRGDQESSVTNFFKTDKKYHSVILERIRSKFLLDDWERGRFEEKFNKVFL